MPQEVVRNGLFKVRHTASGSVYIVYEVESKDRKINFLMYFMGKWQYVDSNLFKEYKFKDWKDYTHKLMINPDDLTEDDIRALMRRIGV